MPLPPASGLKDTWKTKAKLNNGYPQDGPIGGLTDEHALFVCPQFDKRKQGNVTGVSFEVYCHTVLRKSNNSCVGCWRGIW